MLTHKVNHTSDPRSEIRVPLPSDLHDSITSSPAAQPASRAAKVALPACSASASSLGPCRTALGPVRSWQACTHRAEYSPELQSRLSLRSCRAQLSLCPS